MAVEQVVEEQKVEKTDDFDGAFAEAVSGVPAVPPAPQEPTEPAVQTSEESETETSVADASVETQEETLDPAAELAALKAELEALKAAKPAPAQEPEPAQPAAPTAESLYTPEEEAKITEFRKEWPEVAAGIDLMMAGAAKQLQQQIFAQLGPALQPLVEQYQISSEEQQYNAIKSVHADYDEIYDNVIAWVDKQPAYIKNALQYVVNEGSAADVVDMITRYKAETGVKAVTPTPTPKVTDLPEAAKKVARSLGVVSSKRSAVPQSQDPTDFDGAWAEATRANG